MDNVIQMTGELDPRSGWSATRCTVARTLDVISTRSAFLILREAFYGTTRFDDFALRARVSEPVAAARLRELVAEGLLRQEAYQEPGQRTRQEYRLTEKGSDLLPAIVALMQWGDRWLDEEGGPVQLLHRDCGEPAGVELRCAAGHEVTAGELDLVRSPSRGSSRSR
jgi:DNA-binding HxlR family transcriptional regulator